MSSLFKYKYADSTSLASINASIESVTNQLNDANAKYNQAMTAIATCRALPSFGKTFGGFSGDCVNATGRHYSTWTSIRDQYAPLIAKYKADLAELLDLQKTMAASSTEKAQSQIVAAQAETAIAQAEVSGAIGTGKKWLIYGGIGIGLIVLVVGGIMVYKKLKKK